MADDQVQTILAPVQADNSIKADAWQAFKDSANEREYGVRLNGMNLPDNVKADLWEAKRKTGTAAVNPESQVPNALLQARGVIAKAASGMQPDWAGVPAAAKPSEAMPGRFGMHAQPSPESTLNALPAFGGAVGGTLGGIPGAALGGGAGEAAQQLIRRAAGVPVTQTPTTDIAKQVALQGTFEGVGQLLSAAGRAIGPAVLKRAAGSFLKGPLDAAGKVIDRFLSQSNLAQRTVDIATPINNLLDDEIAKASRTGATPLAKRLTKLKADWNGNYNLQSPTLLQANQFRREIADFTTFAGEATKDSLNKIQRQTVGIVGDELNKVAGPGLQPLNDNYANLVATQSAVKGSAKKLTTGFTGTGLAAASAAAKKAGASAPNIARALQTEMENR